jgi:hypothetical protein
MRFKGFEGGASPRRVSDTLASRRICTVVASQLILLELEIFSANALATDAHHHHHGAGRATVHADLQRLSSSSLISLGTWHSHYVLEGAPQSVQTRCIFSCSLGLKIEVDQYAAARY